MFNFNTVKTLPVSLIQKPIEQAAIVIWLIAIGQFINFAFASSGVITMTWFITAPALMLASIIVAIRTKNSLPLIIVFLTGLSAVLFLISPELLNDLNFNHILILASLYGLVFWLLFSRFFNSHYILRIGKLFAPDNDAFRMVMLLERMSFYLSFLIINISLIAYVSIESLFFNYISYIVFSAAIIILFISGRFVAKNLRGILLPVYMTLFLISSFNTPDSSINDNPDVANQVLLIWGFALWFFHNVISTVYNRVFSNKQIMTVLWPLFGLVVILFAIVNQASEALTYIPSLLILMVYLFLILRNTSSALISWSVIVLSSWIFFVVLLSPENIFDIPLMLFWEYGREYLSFCLFLLVFSTVWNRYINSFFMRAGWQKISFRKPVLFITFFISLLYLVFNTIIAFAFIAENYELINMSYKIENTSIFVLLLFFSLSLFVTNKVVANLIYFSTLVLLIISWGSNKVVPDYLLFALINLALVLLPSVNQLLNKNTFYWNVIISESMTWVNISFAASLLCLLHSMAISDFDYGTSWLFFNTAILFISSVILGKYQNSQLWHAASYLLAAALIVSVRLMILGTVAVNEIDTIAILVISFIFYAMTHESKLSLSGINTQRLAAILPLSSLLTIPWSAGSVHSSLTLLVLGIFYFIIQNHSLNRNSRFLQYSAFVFINMSVYLWMPVLSGYTGLLLFYVIPVVFSLLCVTHLHKKEIKPGLLNKVRLLALSSLYVVITTDVFINDTLVVFVLGLMFGLAGIIYGISSKTRLFLYTGVSFMVVIIFGQLMMFYPEGRLARALILMVLGVTITGSMIWFNIKREMLLAKIRLFRADLDSWD